MSKIRVCFKGVGRILGHAPSYFSDTPSLDRGEAQNPRTTSRMLSLTTGSAYRGAKKQGYSPRPGWR
jgi:hypothetical protein